VYGCAGVAWTVGTRFISHSLSEVLSESGECLDCMSSIAILEAARWAAVGIRE